MDETNNWLQESYEAPILVTYLKGQADQESMDQIKHRIYPSSGLLFDLSL